MTTEVARPIPLPLPRPLSGRTGAVRSEPPISSGALGMLIFVLTEIMLFAGFVSAFTIVRSGAPIWPPAGQPRLPVESTAFNTLLLFASGVSLFLAARAFRRGERARAQKPLLGAMLLGAGFVGLQGREWLALLAQGLTITSSTLGSFFYLIIGLHALHAVAAIAIVATAWLRLRRGFLAPGLLAAAEVFWYFVVGVWPVLYWRVYLS